jgi:hypothetical protein
VAGDSSSAAALLTIAYTIRLESVRHPGGDIVDVSSRPGLFEKSTGKEVRVDAHQRRVAGDLSLGLHRCLVPDRTGAARPP